MAKHIVFNGTARNKMLHGMEKLAKAVEVTLGAAGPGVIVQHRTRGITPVYTRDGVTVANSIVLSDRIEDLGARMLRDVASAVSRQAGDGTTTAVVLARRIGIESAKALASGVEPTQLKKGIDLAVELVCEHLRSSASLSVDATVIRQICLTSGKDGDRMADLLTEVFEQLGPDAALTIELGDGIRDELTVSEGAHFEKGWLSPYFATQRELSRAELDDPYILLTDMEIGDFMDLVPLLEEIQEQHRSLLIICDGMSERALAGLLLNHVRGVFRAVAVKAPGMGERCQHNLEDLAILTGGRALLQAMGDRLDRLTLADLGQAKRALIDSENTSIVGAVGAAGAVAERIAALEWEAEELRSRKPGQGSPTGNQHDLEMVEERISRLRSKTATYRVGGVTEPEMKERMVRVQNAYNAIKAALAEGILAGGGVALLAAQKVLDGIQTGKPDRQFGVAVVRRALAEPYRCILRNSGVDAEAGGALQDADQGYDARSGRFGNMLEMGIVDPVKVLRLALQNAAGIVGSVITTEAVISDIPVTRQMPSAKEIARWAEATREDPRA
ncbi:MAG: chaperonin GroEL [Methylococcaceae bacterium]|nr:chaperonin GroEL [Methylococcaceae bacterium]